MRTESTLVHGYFLLAKQYSVHFVDISVGGKWYGSNLQLYCTIRTTTVRIPGCQNVVIEAFPVMIATREESTPCSITHPTLSWPPFALVKAFKPIYPAVFALFLRSQVPSLIPAPAASYEWLEFTGHGRSYIVPSRACRSCLLSCRPMGLNFDTLQVPCVAEPGRLGTLSRFFGMHIAPSDYIVVVIVPGTYIVTYMMQIPIRVFIFCFLFLQGGKISCHSSRTTVRST